MAKYAGLQTLEVLEGADNYNRWIASSIRPFIKSPALEIGAGTGNISEQLLHIKELVLTDCDSELVDKLRKRFKKRKNVQVEIFDIAAQLSKPKQMFSTVYSVNVLEHIKDDKKALLNMKKLLTKDGNLVLLVPAKKFAFTKLDKNLGHFRRYEKKEISAKLDSAGFKVKYISYFNVVGLLSWVIRDFVSGDDLNLKVTHVKYFDAIVPFLQFVEPKKILPIGISLIIVASKKDAED